MSNVTYLGFVEQRTPVDQRTARAYAEMAQMGADVTPSAKSVLSSRASSQRCGIGVTFKRLESRSMEVRHDLIVPPLPRLSGGASLSEDSCASNLFDSCLINCHEMPYFAGLRVANSS